MQLAQIILPSNYIFLFGLLGLHPLQVLAGFAAVLPLLSTQMTLKRHMNFILPAEERCFSAQAICNFITLLWY